MRTRPLDEVLLMVKERQGAASNRLRQQEDWKGAAKKRAEVTSEADLRCMAFTDVEVKVATQPNGSSGGAAEAAATSSSGGGAAPAAGVGSSGGGAAAAAVTNGGAAAPAGSSGGGAKPKKVASADSGEWSEAQELALVQGLKQFGKELPDRWGRSDACQPSAAARCARSLLRGFGQACACTAHDRGERRPTPKRKRPRAWCDSWHVALR